MNRKNPRVFPCGYFAFSHVEIFYVAVGASQVCLFSEIIVAPWPSCVHFIFTPGPVERRKAVRHLRRAEVLRVYKETPGWEGGKFSGRPQVVMPPPHTHTLKLPG